MKRSIFVLTLALIMAGGVLAQSRAAKTAPAFDLWGGSGFSVPKIDGIETSKGTEDGMNSVCWGRTYTLMNDNVSFNLALDYSLIRDFEGVEDTVKVVGGSWTMINRNDKRNGVLFGTVTSGSIVWHYGKDGMPDYGVIEVTVNVTGGTDAFNDVVGPQSYGTFTGTVNYSDGAIPVIVGSFDLMF